MTINEYNKTKIENPGKIAQIMTDILLSEQPQDQAKEHFYAIGLNTKNTIQFIELVHLGTLNGCMVHPREIFHIACVKHVNTMILCHNHPSGEPEPSTEDIRLTDKLKQAGKILDIEIIDHIIITTNKDKHYSFKQSNL